MEHCTRCILPESYPGIAFDERGVCGHCLSHDGDTRTRLRDQAELLELIAGQKKNGGEYDCLVAISGGRDSTFMAYYAVRVLGLNVLAYTYDNGFVPKQTRENIENAVRSLGMDHFVDRNAGMRKHMQYMLSSWQRHPSPATISLLCTGCNTGYKRGVTRIARDHQVGLILTGGGEPTESFAVKLLNESIQSPLRKRRYALILGFLGEVVRNPHYLRHPGTLAAAIKEFYWRYCYKPRHAGLRMPSLYRFLEWDEDTILATITEELGWKAPAYSPTSWRSDCYVHLLRQYLYRETLGFTKNDVILSGMIRRGLTTREEALDRLEHENQIPRQFLTTFLDGLGFSLADLEHALGQYERASG